MTGFYNDPVGHWVVVTVAITVLLFVVLTATAYTVWFERVALGRIQRRHRVPVSVGGGVTLYNQAGSTNVIADLEGYFSAPSGTAGQEVALTPARITDTRAGSGQPNAGMTLGPGGQLDVR